MLVRVGMLTWSLLNENDMNDIYTDSTRSFVNTHCLRLVLKVESLYSFSQTMGKQAFIVLTYRKGARFSLVLNLGHSPLYRHFYKCLYIELLKISLVY